MKHHDQIDQVYVSIHANLCEFSQRITSWCVPLSQKSQTYLKYRTSTLPRKFYEDV